MNAGASVLKTLPMNFRIILRSVAFIAILVMSAGVWLNSVVVDSVAVKPLPTAEAVHDALGGAPDFRLDLQADGDWEKLATFRDKQMGEGLTWDVKVDVPYKALSSVRLMEDDLAGDDLIEEHPATGAEFSGVQYSYAVATRRSLSAGLSWFAKTPIGIAVMAAFVLGLGLSFFFSDGVLEVAGALID